jgi:manganese/zinc/iron transport system substrate-binding protein
MLRNTFSLLLLLLLFACENQTDNKNNNRLNIVCTTGMLGDAVENIVKENAEVISLMGPGVDPHLYKATQGDLSLLSKADIIVYNGLHLEGKMGEIFEKLKNRKRIIVAAEAIDKTRLINNTNFLGAYDPHLWFDVSLWADVVGYIGKELAASEDSLADVFIENSRTYQRQLLQLNQEVKEALAQIDSSKRVLITAHDAFAYFGRAYQIEVRGLQGISTVSEYGLKDVSDLVNFICQRKIQAVFVESSVSDRSLKAVVEGCEAKGHSISIGGTLFSDAMGEKESPEGKYIGMVKYNVQSIVKGLK